jgi:hypothetical protein
MCPSPARHRPHVLVTVHAPVRAPVLDFPSPTHKHARARPPTVPRPALFSLCTQKHAFSARGAARPCTARSPVRCGNLHLHAPAAPRPRAPPWPIPHLPPRVATATAAIAAALSALASPRPLVFRCGCMYAPSPIDPLTPCTELACRTSAGDEGGKQRKEQKPRNPGTQERRNAGQGDAGRRRAAQGSAGRRRATQGDAGRRRAT